MMGEKEVSGTDEEENVKWHVGRPQMTSNATESRAATSENDQKIRKKNVDGE